ncbi:MAG: transposase [Chitinophagales bacterium]|nr:transposase [Chitinophagales bacterium]
MGKILSCYLIVRTNEFRNINEPRKLACYAGCSSLEHSSCTSIKGRQRLSCFADKELKKTITSISNECNQIRGRAETILSKKGRGRKKIKCLFSMQSVINWYIKFAPPSIKKESIYPFWKCHRNHCKLLIHVQLSMKGKEPFSCGLFSCL